MKNNHMYAHIDIRNFYAACEQLDSRYKGRPLVIYNESSSGRKAIIAASKEAKQEKISRGVPIEKAKTLPGVILIKSRLEKYEKISNELYQKCIDYLGKKAYSTSKQHIDDIVIKFPGDLKTAVDLTKRVEELYNNLGFELAMGISFNEDYAHMATKFSKKRGRLVYISKDFAEKIIYKQPIIEFPQIGRKRKEKLNKGGIETIGDIANSELDLMMKLLKPNIGSKIYFSVLGLENPKLQLELFEHS